MVSNAPVGSPRELAAQLVTELPVRSLAESLSFYRAAGLTVERATATFAALRLGECYLFLTERTEVEVGASPANIRLIVDDVDASFADAQRRGWTVRHPPADRSYGLRDFTVLDPDGYELRFAAPVSPS